MKARLIFLAASGFLVLPCCHADLPTEAVEALGRQHKRKRNIFGKRKRQAASQTQAPGLFADSGGVELNPDYVSSGTSLKHSRRRANNHRGGGSDEFATLGNQQPGAFQDSIVADYNNNDDDFQQNSPQGLFFTLQKSPTPTTESLMRFFQTVLQQSPTTFWTFASSVAVFILWQFFLRAQWMYTYFVCNQKSAIQSCGASLLLSNISHNSFRHLAIDLLALCHLAPKVWKHSKSFQVTTSGMTLGDIMDKKTAATPLWPLFLGSSLFTHILLVMVQPNKACLGLGGVVMALMGYYYGGVLPPNQTLNFLIGGILPVTIRAQLLVQVLLVVSLIGSFSTRSTLQHFVHLTGLIYGMVNYHGVQQSVEKGKKALKNGVADTLGILGKQKRKLGFSRRR